MLGSLGMGCRNVQSTKEGTCDELVRKIDGLAYGIRLLGGDGCHWNSDLLFSHSASARRPNRIAMPVRGVQRRAWSQAFRP